LRFHEGGLSIQQGLILEGLEKIKATPMGGQMVLLQSEVTGEISRVAESHKAWWEAHFIEVKAWTTNLVASRRSVWLKIFGLALHVWEEETFKKVVAEFGFFLNFDESTITRQIFDVARIKVCIYNMGWISEQLLITVMGVEYALSVVEDVVVEAHTTVEVVTKEEDGFSDGQGGFDDEEVVATEIGVLSVDDDKVSPSKVNPTLLGLEVSTARLSLTNGEMGQKEGLGVHLFGDRDGDTTKEEDFLNLPIEVAHVEEGEDDSGRGQTDGGLVGSGAFNVPLPEVARAHENLEVQHSALPAGSFGLEENRPDSSNIHIYQKRFWVNGPVLSLVRPAQETSVGLKTDVVPLINISSTAVCLEGGQKVNKHYYFRSVVTL